MAIHKSDLAAAKDSRDVSTKSLSGERTGGNVLLATAEYTFGSTPGQPENPYDVIQLADIPAGATVIPQQSYVASHFFGYAVNFKLGDAADVQRHGMAGTNVPAGPWKMITDVPSFGSFGYAASAPTRYATTTRVKAMLVDSFGYPPPGYKVTFGIAYRVQG